MKSALIILTASSLIIPRIAPGQTPVSISARRDSLPIVYATIEADRAGMSDRDSGRWQTPAPPDSAKSGAHVGAHIMHALVGGVLCSLSGLAIGAAVGGVMDAHSNGENMFPAFMLLGAGGAIGGLAIGLLVGAVWPVK
jgi:hypothetical protein